FSCLCACESVGTCIDQGIRARDVRPFLTRALGSPRGEADRASSAPNCDEPMDSSTTSTRSTRRVVRGVALVFAGLLVGVLALLSLGAGVGRYKLIPVDATSAQVDASHNGLAVLVPVPTLSLHHGDLIAARIGNDSTQTLYRVQSVDSWTHEIYGIGHDGK